MTNTNETTGIKINEWTATYGGLPADFRRVQIGIYIAIRVQVQFQVKANIEVYTKGSNGLESYLGYASEVCIHSGNMSHAINMARGLAHSQD